MCFLFVVGKALQFYGVVAIFHDLSPQDGGYLPLCKSHLIHRIQINLSRNGGRAWGKA